MIASFSSVRYGSSSIFAAFANPSATYEEGIQTIMRQAGTAEMPDLTFIGLNRLRMVNERDIPVDLGPFIAKDRNMAEQGFSENILKLAQVGGKNSSLGEMIGHLAKLGVSVPGGFATTADAFQAFIAENIGAGVKIFRGADAPNWGFRIDYRYLFVNENDDAPAFFAKSKSRGAHRVYVGMLYTWKR